MNLDMVDRNSAPEEFACIWQSKRVGITRDAEKMWIHFSMVSLKNSLTFTQDVTDASVNTCCKLKLVFLEKRLWFSCRQYFEIRWGLYVKLKVSRMRTFLWCMRQTSRDRDNSGPVRTHEKNSGETVRWLGTIMQSILCAQSGAGICLNFWK